MVMGRALADEQPVAPKTRRFSADFRKGKTNDIFWGQIERFF